MKRLLILIPLLVGCAFSAIGADQSKYKSLSGLATHKTEQIFNGSKLELMFLSSFVPGKKVNIDPIYAIKIEGMFVNGKEILPTDSLVLLEERKTLFHEGDSSFLYKMKSSELLFEHVAPDGRTKLIEYTIGSDVDTVDVFYRIKYSDKTYSKDLFSLRARNVKFH